MLSVLLAFARVAVVAAVVCGLVYLVLVGSDVHMAAMSTALTGGETK